MGGDGLMALLCVDIGNTNIKLGIYQGEQQICRWRIATDRSRLTDEYAMVILNLFETKGLTLQQITGCAISSVVPTLTQVFQELIEDYFHLTPLVLDLNANIGLQVRTDYPEEVGSDLIANAVAAKSLYGTPVIIVGFGTATTFTAVSADGNLEGVAIAPGIVTSGDSLFRSTSTLPQVALKTPKQAIGKNTTQSLQAGMVYGFASLVDGIVDRIRVELGGSAHVIATGGLAGLIAPESKTIETVEPDLATIGLRIVYERSAGAE